MHLANQDQPRNDTLLMLQWHTKTPHTLSMVAMHSPQAQATLTIAAVDASPERFRYRAVTFQEFDLDADVKQALSRLPAARPPPPWPRGHGGPTGERRVVSLALGDRRKTRPGQLGQRQLARAYNSVDMGRPLGTARWHTK